MAYRCLVRFFFTQHAVSLNCYPTYDNECISSCYSHMCDLGETPNSSKMLLHIEKDVDASSLTYSLVDLDLDVQIKV